MAPETIEGRATDQRSDLYALGCMLHELLAARPPFHGESRNLVLAMHLSATPPALPDGAPAEAQALIDELLAKDPADRPANAAAVRERLQEILADEPSPSPRTTRPRPARPATAPSAALVETAPSAPVPVPASLRRWPWLVAVAALAAVAVVASLRPWDRPPTPIIDDTSRSSGPVEPALVPVDAAPLMSVVEATPDAGPPDAAPVDAGAPADAARPRRAKSSQATPRDAAPADEPEIDFILPR
jgi:serine/threonine protein kinase